MAWMSLNYALLSLELMGIDSVPSEDVNGSFGPSQYGSTSEVR